MLEYFFFRIFFCAIANKTKKLPITWYDREEDLARQFLEEINFSSYYEVYLLKKNSHSDKKITDCGREYEYFSFPDESMNSEVVFMRENIFFSLEYDLKSLSEDKYSRINIKIVFDDDKYFLIDCDYTFKKKILYEIRIKIFYSERDPKIYILYCIYEDDDILLYNFEKQ